MATHADVFFSEVATIAAKLDKAQIEQLAQELVALRERGGRLFLVGVGGSAGNCSHAVNDFRKLCGIEAYAPTDNVSELTARANDEGWETIFTGWMDVSRANAKDALLVFSVGGGDIEKNVSVNIVRAVDDAKQRGMKVFGIVGRATGHTAQQADLALVIPVDEPSRLTPHTEAFHVVVWHCLVSHPILQVKRTKW
ncbi:SIS domain-containing protein [Ferrovibrio sp.]|uniref:SIS domain-containing protein n=1 Tax=Ferrovibrio sp. TaxID=1917215 RepID=UPI0025B90394|nr:SIS domain-containing protein [Ferrovibrio sp.]MBX3454250.1 SIS domain-containing protein [Ferrovibrio sp.]